MALKHPKLWILWLVITIALLVWLTLSLRSEDASIFLPGETTYAHHQIELACKACHTEDFADLENLQDACINCHGEALKIAKDDHPKSKFTDPRNADRIEILDARYCVTCHVEHRPAATYSMAVTLPDDYCYQCHHDIAEDRPSHEGMAFDSCASAGCHNYHDNRALYEDFLAKHLDEPLTLATPQLAKRDFADVIKDWPEYPVRHYPIKSLGVDEQDAPADRATDTKILSDWSSTAHAAAGVNCSGCHQQEKQAAWTDEPDHEVCTTCHKPETAGFLHGMHGMRLDQKRLDKTLSPMQVADARLPMKADASDKQLGCNSCHQAHSYETPAASVDACLSCHADDHSRAFKSSPHYELWLQEQREELPEGSGVSCASCHMPRIEHEVFGLKRTLVQHNQSDTLRPNEKMIRPICMQCHGLGFAIDALADPALIENNFNGNPATHIESLDLARQRIKSKDASPKPETP